MRTLLLSAALLTTPTIAGAQQAPETPYEATPLADPVLAGITGKFLLPDGTAIALSVTTDTRVDGQLLLRSVLTVDQGSTLKVFGGTGGGERTAATGTTAPTPSGVSILFDRQTGVRTVTPTVAATPGVTVNTGMTAGTQGATQVVPLALTPGGPAVQTPGGLVSLAGSGNQVSLAGDRIDVTHVLGPAFATAVANTANDRTIDTVVSIDIDVNRTIPFAVNSSTMRAGDLALDATRALAR